MTDSVEWIAERATTHLLLGLEWGCNITYHDESEADYWEHVLKNTKECLLTEKNTTDSVHQSVAATVLRAHKKQLWSFKIWREGATVFLGDYPLEKVKIYEFRG